MAEPGKHPFPGLSWLLIGLLLGVGCTARLPLDTPVPPPAPIDGAIIVTTFSQGVVAGGVTVTVTSFNGSTKTVVTASYPSFGVVQGQAVVSEPSAGTYLVSVAGQPSSAPNTVKVTLSPGAPVQNVNLQLSGATLTFTSADGLPTTFGEASGVHVFKISYTNASNFQQDISLLPIGLPPGWTYTLTSTQLTVGKSALFYVYNPTAYANALTLTANGYVKANVVAAATQFLGRSWSVAFTIGVLGASYCGNSNGPNLVQFSATGMPGAPASNADFSGFTFGAAGVLTNGSFSAPLSVSDQPVNGVSSQLSVVGGCATGGAQWSGTLTLYYNGSPLGTVNATASGAQGSLRNTVFDF